MKDKIELQLSYKFCKDHRFKDGDIIQASYDPKKSIIQLREIKKNLN